MCFYFMQKKVIIHNSHFNKSSRITKLFIRINYFLLKIQGSIFSSSSGSFRFLLKDKKKLHGFYLCHLTCWFLLKDFDWRSLNVEIKQIESSYKIKYCTSTLYSIYPGISSVDFFPSIILLLNSLLFSLLILKQCSTLHRELQTKAFRQSVDYFTQLFLQ